MFRTNFKNRDNRDFLSAFLTAVGLVIIYSLSKCFMRGQYSLCTGDFWGQYVPFVKSFIFKIFGDGSFTYSFSSGLGEDIIANYAYFSCFSPFTVIYFLIDDAIVASNIVIILKFSIASFFFYRFSKQVLKKTGAYVVAFSVAYALGSFSIVSVINIHFMDAMYILPIVIIGIYKFLTTNKRNCLILIYAYAFINCFYTGYVVGIFSFIVFILALGFFYINRDKGFDVKYFWRKVVDYIICVMIAALISGVVIIPTAAYILTHMAQDGTVYGGMQATIFDVLSSFYMLVIRNNYTSLPFFYCGLPVLVAVPAFFVSKSEGESIRIKAFAGTLLAILVVSTVVATPYLFWHCMDAPDGIGYRFGYLVVFLVCAMSVFGFDKIDFKQSKLALIFLVISFGYLLSWYILSAGFTKTVSGFSLMGALINFVVLLVYLLILKFMNDKNKRALANVFIAIYFVELCFNGFIACATMIRSYYPNTAVVDCLYMQEDYVSSMLPEDCGHYRVYQKNSYPNVLQQYNINGVGVYFTTFENPRLRNTMHQLGYVSTPRVLSDYGSTPVMQMLLAEKYDVEINGIVVDNQITIPQIETNEYALSIGYMVDKSVMDIDFVYDYQDINPFENQNQLVSALLGETVAVFEPLEGEPDIESEHLDVYNDDESLVYVLEEVYDSGTLDLTVFDDSKEPIYAYFPQAYSTNRTYIPTIKSAGADEGSFLLSSITSLPHILEVNDDGAGLHNVEIAVQRGMEIEGGRIYDAFFYRINSATLRLVYEKLSACQLDIMTFEDGYIEGTIMSHGDEELLFVSVPYDEGWNAYIDGARTQIIPVVNNTFMAISVPEGEHTIVLKYNNRLVTYGLFASIAGLVLFVIASIREKGFLDTRRDS